MKIMGILWTLMMNFGMIRKVFRVVFELLCKILGVNILYIFSEEWPGFNIQTFEPGFIRGKY